jgi:anti-anti-sigma factor
VLDLTDLAYLDSSGLGTLVGLKVSAAKEGYCRLELVNLSSRVKELLRLSNLTQLFAS